MPKRPNDFKDLEKKLRKESVLLDRCVRALDSAGRSSHQNYRRYLDEYFLGEFQRRPDHYGEAVIHYSSVINAVELSSFEAGRELQARALLGRARTQGNKHKYPEEVADYDKLILDFSADSSLGIREQVAAAARERCLSLAARDKIDAAFEGFERLLNRDVHTEPISLTLLIAQTAVDLSFILDKKNLSWAGRPLTLYHRFLTHFASATDPALRTLVATILYQTGVALEALGDPDAALGMYEKLTVTYGRVRDPGLTQPLLRARFNIGGLQEQSKQFNEAIATYRTLIDGYAASKDPGVQEWVARAMVKQGMLYAQHLGDKKHALRTYDALQKRYGRSTHSNVLPWVLRGICNQGLIHRTSSQTSKALRTFEAIIDGYRTSDNPAILEVVGQAMISKGNLLADEKRWKEAIAAVAPVLTLPGLTSDLRPTAQEALTNYHKEKSSLLSLMTDIFETFPKKTLDLFFDKMAKEEEKLRDFLKFDSRLPTEPDSPSVLLNLREWNSYTPALPNFQTAGRGGGYFILYRGQGIVIDPGYDFIRNFSAVGGRICNLHHIFVTHAHNDHTQDFESILSLLYQYNRKAPEKRKIHLYLSQGAAKKLTAFLTLRNTHNFGRLEILDQGFTDPAKTIPLYGLEGAQATVLRAYHDDGLTMDFSVGLGFEFDFNGSSRKILFTGDTGLFPPKKDPQGYEKRNDDGELETDVDLDHTPLFGQYPPKFMNPDLLVPHLGSIKKKEADNLSTIKTIGDRDPSSAGKDFYFYPTHLGLLGLTILLDNLAPKAAMVGEFGEELKHIRFNLIDGIEKVLNRRRNSAPATPADPASPAPQLAPIFLLPGDLTLAYDIQDGRFFCHGNQKYLAPGDLQYLPLEEPDEAPFYCRDVPRVYLFKKDQKKGKALRDLQRYYIAMRERKDPVPWHYFERDAFNKAPVLA